MRIAAAEAEAEQHVVQHPKPRQQPGVLEGDGHPGGHGQLTRTGHVVVELGQGAQQRALAGTALPQQGHEFAARDLQVQIVQHDMLAEPADQGGRANRAGGGGQPASVRRHDSTRLSMIRIAASETKPNNP